MLRFLHVLLASIGITHLGARGPGRHRGARLLWQLTNVLYNLLVVVSEVVFMVRHADDAPLLMDVIGTALSCFMDLIKVTVHAVHRHEIKDMFDRLVLDDYERRMPLVRRALNEQSASAPALATLRQLLVDSKASLTRNMDLCLKLYFALAYSTISSMLLSPLVLVLLYPERHAKELPFGMSLPWDVKKYYMLTYLFHVYGAVYVASALVALDVLIALLLGQVKRQLTIVGHIVTNVDELVREALVQTSSEATALATPDHDSELRWERGCTAVLASCADHYSHVKRFVTRLNAINRPFFVVPAVCCSVLMCMCLFKIAYAESKTSMAVIQYYLYMLIAVVQIGIYCFVGQILINEWERLQTCTVAGWWSHGTRHRSTVKILQTELQRPLALYIWGSIDLSNSTLLSTRNDDRVSPRQQIVLLEYMEEHKTIAALKRLRRWASRRLSALCSSASPILASSRRISILSKVLKAGFSYFALLRSVMDK